MVWIVQVGETKVLSMLTLEVFGILDEYLDFCSGVGWRFCSVIIKYDSLDMHFFVLYG